MKIMHLASGDLWAGAEVQLFHLAKELNKIKNVELIVVLLNHGQLEDELLKHNVNVKVLDESMLSSFAIFQRLNSIIKLSQPDIIHTHRNKENFLGGLAAWLNKKKSIRTSHGASEISKNPINLKRRLFDSLDKFAAVCFQQRIVAVSEDLRKKLSHHFPDAKLLVIENAVDTAYIKNRASQEFGHSSKLDRNDFHIAFIGRFVPVKRVELFFAIANNVQLRNASRNIQFHMIGDGPLFQEINDKIRNDPNAPRIHLHGFIENVAPILKQMNLLIFTSDHEGLPMTLLEAMTLHIPVLSRFIPSIYDVLCQGKCGYFIDTDSPEKFARAIEHIIISREEVEQKANNAYNRIMDNFDIAVNVRNYVRLYTDLLSE